MATKDFRASQVETSKIIGSGSITGTTVGIAVYSGSVASNREGGTSDSTMFDNVGSDVFLFVSGTIDNTNNTRTNATLFGGDVVVSGTLYAERQVIEVDSVADGDFFVTGNMYVEPDTNSAESAVFRKADGTNVLKVNTEGQNVDVNGNLILTGNIHGGASESDLTINSEGRIILNADSDGDSNEDIRFNFNNVTHHEFRESSGVIFNKAGSADLDFQVRSDTDLASIFVDAGEEAVAIGWGSPTPITPVWSELTETGTDVKILLSGTVGSQGGATRGTTLNSGDLVVSGNTTFFGEATFQPNQKVFFDGFGDSNGPWIRGNTTSLTLNGDNKVFVFYDDLVEFTSQAQPNRPAIHLNNDGRVLIHSGGAASSYDEASGADVNFYASGSVGSRGTATRGTSVFGGDLVVSGNIVALGTATGFGGGGGSGNTLDQAYDQGGAGAGAIVTVDGQAIQLVRGTPGDIVLGVTGSAIFGETSSEFANKLPPLPGSDVTFFVSGSVGSRQSPTGGVAVFGGDLVASGSVFGKQMQVYHYFDNINTNSQEHFFGIHQGLSSTSFDGPKHNRIMPFKGRIKAFALRCERVDVGNSLVVKFYANLFNAANANAGSSVTKNVTINSNQTTFTDKVGLEFNQGGIIAVSVERAGSQVPNDVHIAVTVEYDIFDDPVL